MEIQRQTITENFFDNLFSNMCMFVSLHEFMCSTCMQVPAKWMAPEETVVSCRGGVQTEPRSFATGTSEPSPQTIKAILSQRTFLKISQ